MAISNTTDDQLNQVQLNVSVVQSKVSYFFGLEIYYIFKCPLCYIITLYIVIITLNLICTFFGVPKGKQTKQNIKGIE